MSSPGGLGISIFGLGYVGCVTAGCLAKLGHKIHGVDVNPGKVETLSAGNSPIVEPGLAALLRQAVSGGRLSAGSDPGAAVRQTSVSFICVGTPSRADGSPDYKALFGVCRQIGAALKARGRRHGYHLVVIRSTCVPGTAARAARVLERASGMKAGRQFGVAVNPEFLREGTAITDFMAPPFVVVGTSSEQDAGILRSIHKELPAEFVATDIQVAEMLKFASNAFHAVKVTFANELGALCKAMSVDSHSVMNIFCRDTKLNISTAYLKPGFAFGGSCLPKDLRALNQMARGRSVDAPLLAATLASNNQQIESLVGRLLPHRKEPIGILGLAFKSGTDDLRESPMVKVTESLLGRGCRVSVYDPNILLSRLVGANKTYIEQEIPHLSRLLLDEVEKLIRESTVLVIGGRDGLTPGWEKLLRRSHRVFDLVRAVPEAARRRVRYEGLYW